MGDNLDACKLLSGLCLRIRICLSRKELTPALAHQKRHIKRFTSHLNQLKSVMEKRVSNLKVYDWMINHFTANAVEGDITC